MTPLAIRQLSVSYAGANAALSGLSLTIEVGQCVAIVGASGSGKSTLARAILGLLPRDAATHGSILLSSVEVIGVGPARRRALSGKLVGYVPQDALTACNPVRCVGHHVAEAWKSHGQHVAGGEVIARLQALNVDDAWRCMIDKPHQWSGGMLQRCAIAAAIAHDPPLVVADEPTSALNHHLALAVLEQVKAVSRSQLIVSHDLGLACLVANEIVVLDKGRIVETAVPDKLLRKPKSLPARRLVEAYANSAGAFI